MPPIFGFCFLFDPLQYFGRYRARRVAFPASQRFPCPKQLRLTVRPHRSPSYSYTAQAYLERIALTQPGVRRVCLIAKAGLLGMYASCGFALKGLSPVVHGKDPWFEMRVDLDATEPRLMRFVQVHTMRDECLA